MADRQMKTSIDLELISQRVLKLAEIAMLEHLEANERSQAVGLTAMTADSYGNVGEEGW